WPSHSRLEPSHGGVEYALPLYPGDRRSTMINGALPTVAALASGHEIVVIDENVEAIDWAALDRFDVIGVTGMNVQRERQREILERLREVDAFVVVGGP